MERKPDVGGLERVDYTQGRRAFPDNWGDLAARCKDIRKYIEAKELASKEEVDAVWPEKEPGKKHKPEDFAWAYCNAQLARFLEREDPHEKVLNADAEALKAVRDVPVDVSLTTGHTLRVYPKSYECLEWFGVRDRLLDWLTDQEAMLWGLYEDGKLAEEPASLIERVVAERSRQLVLMAAQACREGPTLDPDPPLDDVRELGAIDLMRIHSGFIQANANRLLAVRAVKPPRKGEKSRPMQWSVLFATAADRWKVEARSLACHRSLMSVLASLELAAPDPIEELERA